MDNSSGTCQDALSFPSALVNPLVSDVRSETSILKFNLKDWAPSLDLS